jgi:hypothetical protein
LRPAGHIVYETDIMTRAIYDLAISAGLSARAGARLLPGLLRLTHP